MERKEKKKERKRRRKNIYTYLAIYQSIYVSICTHARVLNTNFLLILPCHGIPKQTSSGSVSSLKILFRQNKLLPLFSSHYNMAKARFIIIAGPSQQCRVDSRRRKNSPFPRHSKIKMPRRLQECFLCVKPTIQYLNLLWLESKPLQERSEGERVVRREGERD